MDPSKQSTTQIKSQIKKNASPRHVPKKIIVVKDIPRTKSGKIVELAVKSKIEGSEIKNIKIARKSIVAKTSIKKGENLW